MTDGMQAAVDVPASPVQVKLAEIRAAREAQNAKAAAAAQVETERGAALDAAKARCAAECDEVTAALAEAIDPQERQALIDLGARTHAVHAADLEAAYLAFSGQRSEGSNPAPVGVETPITADVVVTSEDSPL